jgi:agmatinase
MKPSESPAVPAFTFAAPRNFLGLPDELSSWERSRVAVLPVPYDRTTSYMPGARFGPRAVMDASRNLETYDDELDMDVSESGIHTLPELEAPAAGPEVMVGEIRETARWVLGHGKFLVTIGGDHSVAIGVLQAHAEKYPDLSIVQFDAHADIKESWEGTAFSHASVMRPMGAAAKRILSVGIRSMNREEAAFLKTRPEIEVLTVPRLRSDPTAVRRAIDKLTSNVYLTMDVDGFDPSVIPATGTPEPGGLLWYEGLAIIRELAERRRIVGFDVMELAPIPGFVASDFVVSKLIYKTLGYIAAAGGLN